MTAHAGLCPLPDLDFNGVRRLQIFFRHAVFVGDILKNIFIRRSFFFRKDTAFPAAHGSLGQSGTFCQRYLGFFGKGAK